MPQKPNKGNKKISKKIVNHCCDFYVGQPKRIVSSDLERVANNVTTDLLYEFRGREEHIASQLQREIDRVEKRAERVGKQIQRVFNKARKVCE